MSIYLGNTEIGKIYLGNTEISEAYLGNTKVYGGGSPPPTYDSKVEYLACTGLGEKIDTGINPTNKTRVSGKVMFTAANSVFFCSRWNDGNTNTLAVYNSSTTLYFLADNGGTNHRALTNDNRRLNNALDIDFDISSVKVALNGTSILNTTLQRGTFTSTAPIILFNLVDAYKAISRIYGAKIYEDGVLVRDFVPVRVGQVGYMYDEVSGTLFGNAGAGAFTFGNDIN